MNQIKLKLDPWPEIGILPSLKAIDLGASMIGHFCLSRKSFVHHIECSLMPLEFREMKNISESRNFKSILNAFLDKQIISQDFICLMMKKIFF